MHYLGLLVFLSVTATHTRRKSTIVACRREFEDLYKIISIKYHKKEA